MAAALMTLAVVGVTASSKADSFTQTFTINSPILSGGRFFGTSFSQFDPTLGILNSISVSIKGNVIDSTGTIISFGVIESNPFTIQSYSGSRQPFFGTTSASFDLGGDSTFDIPFFVGTGIAQLGLQVGNFGSAAINVTPLSTVTYNYTAFAPVAVPGPVAGAGIPALLALGGMIWARRRKLTAA